MINLIHQVIAEVRAGEALDFQRTLLQAALLFEKFHGLAGWQEIDSEVGDADVTEESIHQLREALMAFCRMNREHHDTGSALWALGKCRGFPLREFFLTEMRFHCEAKRIFPLHQAESALFHFGGGLVCDWPPQGGEDAYLKACRRFLESNRE